jgi:retinol dehydrogenase-14
MNTALLGKVCLITGGTRGIGRETARGLANMGATVVVAGRDQGRIDHVVRSLVAETGNPAITGLVADVSVQSEVVRLAAAFRTAHDRLDILVNNAGAIFDVRQVSADGVEMTWALNHLAPFRLTHELRDLLVASAPARIVTVASGAHMMARINFDDLQGERNYSGWRAYGQSKLANILFTLELARRLQGTKVTANAVHPGFVASNFGMDGQRTPIMQVGWQVARLFARSPEAGAQTSIYLASSPEVEGVSGVYFANRKPAFTSGAARDLAAARRLWVVSLAQCGLDGTDTRAA